MIDREHDLPITQQTKSLGISRGSVYDRPRPVSPADLAILRRIDELHLELPFAGSRMPRDLLNQEGIEIGRCHVATLMKRMGVEALYRKPNISKPVPGHKIDPYLLRGMTIDRPNQVGPWISPMSRWRAASSLSLPWSTGSAVAFSPGGCRSPWRRRSASRRWRKHSPDMAVRRSSTPIKVRSSRARPSRACCSRQALPSAWTVRDPGATTSSLSASGGPSRTRRST